MVDPRGSWKALSPRHRGSRSSQRISTNWRWSVARAGRYPRSPSLKVSRRSVRARYPSTTATATWAPQGSPRDVHLLAPQLLAFPLRCSPGMDLVSCRNLLIYLGPEIQSRVIPVFHYSLVGLAVSCSFWTSENISQYGRPLLDSRQEIFGVSNGGTMPEDRFDFFFRGAITGCSAPYRVRPSGSVTGTWRSRLRAGSSSPRCWTTSLPLTSWSFSLDGDVVYYSARTGKYLEPLAGLAPEPAPVDHGAQGVAPRSREKRAPRSQGRRAATRHVREGIAVDGEDGRVQPVTLTVEPLADGERRRAAVPRAVQPTTVPLLSREDGDSTGRPRCQMRRRGAISNASCARRASACNRRSRNTRRRWRS